jgi:hypothetical protein
MKVGLSPPSINFVIKFIENEYRKIVYLMFIMAKK